MLKESKVLQKSLLILSLASVPVTAVQAEARAPESLRDQLVALETERQEAFVRGDRAILERQFASEYSHTNLRGGTTSRAEELDFYAPGTMELEQASIEDVTVHDYGKVAVLLGTVTWHGAKYRPAPSSVVDLSGRFRVTRVYLHRDGRWQLATSHASQMPAPAPAPAQPTTAQEGTQRR